MTRFWVVILKNRFNLKKNALDNTLIKNKEKITNSIIISKIEMELIMFSVNIYVLDPMDHDPKRVTGWCITIFLVKVKDHDPKTPRFRRIDLFYRSTQNPI